MHTLTMTCNLESTAATTNAGDNGGRKSLLTDYSKFKAPLSDAGKGESRPRVPSPTYCTNSTSESRGRSCSQSRATTRGCAIPLEDDQYRLERLHRLEQEIQRIEVDIELQANNNNNEGGTLRGSSHSKLLDEDSIGLCDFLNDDGEEEEQEEDETPNLAVSMPDIALQDAHMFLKPNKANSSSLSSFSTGLETTSTNGTTTTTTGLTKEDNPNNKIAFQTRRRSLGNNNAANRNQSPMTRPPDLERSKSLEMGPCPDPTGSAQLRRFRRERKSRTNPNEDCSSNWHNSTGQINFDTSMGNSSFSSGSQRRRRSTIRRTKSTVDSNGEVKTTKKQLPPRAKTYTSSYTTSLGKSFSDLDASSNHGFLTGSRIKRHTRRDP